MQIQNFFFKPAGKTGKAPKPKVRNFVKMRQTADNFRPVYIYSSIQRMQIA